MALRVAVAPSPPLAEPTATLAPPTEMALPKPRPGRARVTASPPSEETGRATPPAPPSPATTTPRTALAARPVSPESASAAELAPELAPEEAVPDASASPVSPESPESPLSAGPPMATAMPRMAVLTAVGTELASPVLPVSPVSPEVAAGLDSASLSASPVSPVLVALDWAVAAPEAPEVATGLAVRPASAPTPPSALPIETLLPPTAPKPMPPRAIAAPPGAATGMATPPAPPSEATARPKMTLAAGPLSPDSASAAELAPELAKLDALPMAVASPESPESPESPDSAPPEMAMAVPSSALLVAVGLEVASPVSPVSPVSPLVAVGLDSASLSASPVSPVLVALDWAVAAPVSPEVATGLAVMSAEPALPELAVPTATLEPPMTTAPGAGATGAATPAPPPEPPRAATRVTLRAPPESPDSDAASELAPELAKLEALPMAVALPESPESPESPDEEASGLPTAPPFRFPVVPNTLAMPRMPVLRANGLVVAEPLVPGVPVWPDSALGLETASDSASPVSPVLVALDCALESPVLPDVALGAADTVALPPAPPLAELMATEPGATTMPVPTLEPAVPPVPPTATMPVMLTAAPLEPEEAVADELAPVLALLVALPVAFAAPVSPVAPSSAVASACGVCATSSATGAAVVSAAACVCSGTDVSVGAGSGVSCATAGPAPRKTRIAAVLAPTRPIADLTLPVPALPFLMLIPFRCWTSTTMSGTRSLLSTSVRSRAAFPAPLRTTTRLHPSYAGSGPRTDSPRTAHGTSRSPTMLVGPDSTVEQLDLRLELPELTGRMRFCCWTFTAV